VGGQIRRRGLEIRIGSAENKGGMSLPQQQQQQQQQGKAPKRELQGPRPGPLKIWRNSHKIRKPPLPVPMQVPAMPYRPPVIIYTHSPEVIHTEAREFMTLVQRLTGHVNAQGNSSLPPSFSIQSQTSHVLPHSHTPLSGNPNFCQILASPSPSAGGLDFLVKEDNSIASLSNPSEFSGNIRSQYPAVQSLLSPTIQYGSMSPLSPNFFLPSPRLFSPNIFHEFPLCTPQPDYLYSPYRHLLRMQSEPIFTPHAIDAAASSLPSPLPTDYDLFNNSTSDMGI